MLWCPGCLAGLLSGGGGHLPRTEAGLRGRSPVWAALPALSPSPRRAGRMAYPPPGPCPHPQSLRMATGGPGAARGVCPAQEGTSCDRGLTPSLGRIFRHGSFLGGRAQPRYKLYRGEGTGDSNPRRCEEPGVPTSAKGPP